jgi:uncharacterized protein YcfJ
MQFKNVVLIICALIVAFCAIIGTTVFVVKSTRTSEATTSASQTNQQSQTTSTEEMAQIVFVRPYMITYQVPYTSCYQRGYTVRHKSDRIPIEGGIIGGVAGGLLGSQIGSGGGKGTATVLGAVGGALAGGAVQKSMEKPRYHRVAENVCVRKVRTEQKQHGFEVVYLYKGVQGTRILDAAPIGTQIPIAVLLAAPTPDQVVN